MELKWQRVNKIEELKTGDIIRINPEYMCEDFYMLMSRTTNRGSLISYPVVIFYNKRVFFRDNKLIYDEMLGESSKTFTKDLLFSGGRLDSWIDKLIIEGEKSVNKYSDEIDLLLDNIMTEETIYTRNIVSYISDKLRGLFVRITSNNDIQILASSSFQLKFNEKDFDREVADKFINDCIDEFIYRLEKLKVK